jgi:hypothetical protein
MAKRNNPHVVPRSDIGGWAVQREGASRASSLHSTQADAIAVARRMAQNERSELFIHGRDGRIRDRDSFGNDPCPPRDTKY